VPASHEVHAPEADKLAYFPATHKTQLDEALEAW